MKRLLYFSILLYSPSLASLVVNPARISLSTNTTGANTFIFNQNTLQSGALFHTSTGIFSEGRVTLNRATMTIISGVNNIITSTINSQGIDIQRIPTAYSQTVFRAAFIDPLGQGWPVGRVEFQEGDPQPSLIFINANFEAKTSANVPKWRVQPAQSRMFMIPASWFGWMDSGESVTYSRMEVLNTTTGGLLLRAPVSTSANVLAIGAPSTQTGRLQTWYVGTSTVAAIGSDGGFYPGTKTLAEFAASSSTVVGVIYRCSDCVTYTHCTSTGAAIVGAYSALGLKTTVCQ